eukprot:9500497-Pyramimonas_sp.AAC.2
MFYYVGNMIFRTGRAGCSRAVSARRGFGGGGGGAPSGPSGLGGLGGLVSAVGGKGGAEAAAALEPDAHSERVHAQTEGLADRRGRAARTCISRFPGVSSASLSLLAQEDP